MRVSVDSMEKASFNQDPSDATNPSLHSLVGCYHPSSYQWKVTLAKQEHTFRRRFKGKYQRNRNLTKKAKIPKNKGLERMCGSCIVGKKSWVVGKATGRKINGEKSALRIQSWRTCCYLPKNIKPRQNVFVKSLATLDTRPRDYLRLFEVKFIFSLRQTSSLLQTTFFPALFEVTPH